MSKRSWLRRRPLVRIITAATVGFCSFIWNSLRIQNRAGGADSEPGSDEGSENRMNRRDGKMAGGAQFNSRQSTQYVVGCLHNDSQAAFASRTPARHARLADPP